MTDKVWYKSKTKIGAFLVGLGAAAGTIGAYMQGQVSLAMGIQALITEVGAVWLAWGFRDLPLVNKAK